ncbi:MAG: CPBP family intramembrane metalloprotease [Tannerellaceae bacterium]|jgi:membrane protease YdiL (CAAX protease family)|nr:CPBP family intramembrane metalloprotease [Tannerellaceae bacterium]
MNHATHAAPRRIAFTAAAMTAGLIASSALTIGLASVLQPAAVIQITQVIAPILTFLLPAAACAAKYEGGILKGLRLNQPPAARTILAATLAVLLLQPAISLAAMINEQLTLPQFMQPIETWMRTMEDAAQAHIEAMFNRRGPLAILYNLLVMGIIASLCEELFFRGALMSSLQSERRTPHAAIWITAVIFSAIHLQFYGFLPRLLLGAFFGYIVAATRSLYPAIAAHFANNALIVIIMSIPQVKATSLATGDIPAREIWIYILATALTIPLFIQCVKKGLAEPAKPKKH